MINKKCCIGKFSCDTLLSNEIDPDLNFLEKAGFTQNLWSSDKLLIYLSNKYVVIPYLGLNTILALVGNDENKIDKAIELQSQSLFYNDRGYLEIMKYILSVTIQKYTRLSFDFYDGLEEKLSENIGDVEGVVKIILENKNVGAPASTTPLGKPISKYYINISKNNNNFFISEDGTLVNAVFISLTIKKYDSIEEFLVELNSKLSNRYLNFAYTAIAVLHPTDKSRFKIKIMVNNNNFIQPMFFSNSKYKFCGFPSGTDISFLNNEITSTFYIYFIATSTIIIRTFSVQAFVHEFMHVLGFIHTHQISNNNPIETADWIVKKIKSDYKIKRPNLTDVQITAIVNTNYIKRPELLDGSTFDKNSIMCYDIPECYNTKEIIIKSNYCLSQLDKIALSTAYKKLVKENYINRPSSNNRSLLVSLVCILFVIIILVLI